MNVQNVNIARPSLDHLASHEVVPVISALRSVIGQLPNQRRQSPALTKLPLRIACEFITLGSAVTLVIWCSENHVTFGRHYWR